VRHWSALLAGLVAGVLMAVALFAVLDHLWATDRDLFGTVAVATFLASAGAGVSAGVVVGLVARAYG
jgi:hypothetical protein